MTKDQDNGENFSSLSIFTIFNEHLSIFEGLWKKWINNGFQVLYEQIRQEIENFLYNPYYSVKDPNYQFFKRFISLINEYYDVDKAFLDAGGLQSPYGICWIRYRIQKYYNHHGKLPSPIDLRFLQTYLSDHGYEKYGYSSWERFITHNLVYPSKKDHFKIRFRFI